jgi:hypothetical protein
MVPKTANLVIKSGRGRIRTAGFTDMNRTKVLPGDDLAQISSSCHITMLKPYIQPQTCVVLRIENQVGYST